MPKTRDPQQYDEEYQALQATLEDYLREQVSLLSDSGPAPTAAPDGWFRRHWADVYFVVMLALVGLLWWRTPVQSPPAQVTPTVTTPPQETVPPPPPPAAPPAAAVRPDPPLGFDDLDAWWQSYVTDHAAVVASWLVAVSEARGLAPDQVSPRQKQNFATWSASVRAVSALDANLLAGLRRRVHVRGIAAARRRARPGALTRVVRAAGQAAPDGDHRRLDRRVRALRRSAGAAEAWSACSLSSAFLAFENESSSAALHRAGGLSIRPAWTTVGAEERRRFRMSTSHLESLPTRINGRDELGGIR